MVTTKNKNISERKNNHESNKNYCYASSGLHGFARSRFLR